MSGTSYVLPNGIKIFHRNRYETDFVYKEIFDNRIYLKHGIQLGRKPHVLDVGANIGLFTLFIKLEFPEARIDVFEPSKELVHLIRLNLAQFVNDVRIHQMGLGESEKEMRFSYYPGYTIMSGFHANETSDRTVLSKGIRNQIEIASKNKIKVNNEMIDAIIGDKLQKAETYMCPIVSLSNFIYTHKIDSLDLLKIDAEQCETEILRGIKPVDWHKIRQIVIEAHSQKMADEVIRTLTDRNFSVTFEQENQFKASGIYNIYGIRIRK